MDLEASVFQEGTIVKVITAAEPEPRLGKIVAIDDTQFHMFKVEFLATRKRENFAGFFLEPV